MHLLFIYGTVAEHVSENDGEKFVLKIRDHTIQNNLKLRFTQRDLGMMAIYYIVKKLFIFGQSK